MTDLAWAKAIHVVAVVIWIGGVAMATTVVLPLVRSTRSADERLVLFTAIERRFAWQARLALVVVLLSGLYMLWRLDLWRNFADLGFWWLHAMVGVWLIFALLLFVIEPLILHHRFERFAREKSATAFWRLQIAHWVLLILALITILGAVAGSSGLTLFG